MALPIIEDVYRVTLNWAATVAVIPRNVWHFRAPAGDAGDVAAALDASLTNNMFLPITTDYTCNSIDILPLDGTSVTSTYVITGPAGLSNTEYVPALAALVKFRTNTRGPKARGRMFLGPIGEGANVSGKLSSGNVTTMQTAWTAFTSAMGAAGVPLVVASYAHAEAFTVTIPTVEQTLATQRRRQDQLR